MIGRICRKTKRLVKYGLSYISLKRASGVCPPALGTDEYLLLDKELQRKNSDISIERIYISSSELSNFEKNLDFCAFYKKGKWKRYDRKICEYWLAYHLTGLAGGDNNFVYIDGAGSSSPWVKWLRENIKCQAFTVDIAEPMPEVEYYVKSDITHMPFKDGSVDAISLQSALETFPEDVDIRFINEAYRVLKSGGGTVVISPIYLNTMYCNACGISYFKQFVAEPESLKCVRLDFDMPFTRLYDVQHFYERIIITACKIGFKCKMYIIESDVNMKDEKDSYIYMRYALQLVK